MQTTGYIILDNRKVLILARHAKTKRYMKVRKSGHDGVHFPDEEFYLNLLSVESDCLKKKLLSGKTICL